MAETERPKEIATSPFLRISIAGVFVVLAACAILFAAREQYKRNPPPDATQPDSDDQSQGKNRE